MCILTTPSSLSALAPVFKPKRGAAAECGPRAPKAPRRGAYDREREHFERDRRFLRDRAHDVRGRPSHYRPRMHVPLGVRPRTVNGDARYEARRSQLYYHGMRPNEYEVSDGEVEEDVCGGADG